MLLLGEQVEFVYGDIVEGSLAGLEDDVFLVVYDLVEFFAGYVEEGADLVGEM